MKCRDCYKYPFCNKIKNPDDECPDGKSKREKLEEENHIKELRQMIIGMLEG